jgi:hypothetical protein
MNQDMQPMTLVMQPMTCVMLVMTFVMLTVTLVMPILTAYTYSLSARAPCTLLSIQLRTAQRVIR